MNKIFFFRSRFRSSRNSIWCLSSVRSKKISWMLRMRRISRAGVADFRTLFRYEFLRLFAIISNGFLGVRAHVFVFVFASFLLCLLSPKHLQFKHPVYGFVYCHWQLEHCKIRLEKVSFPSAICVSAMEVFCFGHALCHQTKLTFDVRTHATNSVSKQCASRHNARK